MPEVTPIVVPDKDLPIGYYNYGRTTDKNLQELQPDVKGANISFGWDEVELKPGEYTWTSLDSELDACVKNKIPFGLQVFLGSSAPTWLYAAPYLVPLVKTKPDGNNADFQKSTYPYYLETTGIYRDRYESFLIAVLNHIADRGYDNLLVYWGVCEGTTGDVSPYKGKPDKKEYEISTERWRIFRHDVWEYYNTKIKGRTRLIFNPGNDYLELDYIMQNYPEAGIKEGNAGHGVNYVGSLVTYNLIGTKSDSRTETDGSLRDREPTYTEQINFAMPLQALALGVDIFCTSIKDVNRNAMKVYNQYIEGMGGLCFMHDCIDFADIIRFPLIPFGEVIDPDKYEDYKNKVAENGTSANGQYNTAKLTEKYLNPVRKERIMAVMGKQGALNLPDSYSQNDYSVAAYSEPYQRNLKLLNPHYQQSWWRIGKPEDDYGQWGKTFKNAVFVAVNQFKKVSVTYYDQTGFLQVNSVKIYGNRTDKWVTHDFYVSSAAGAPSFLVNSTLIVVMLRTN